MSGSTSAGMSRAPAGAAYAGADDAALAIAGTPPRSGPIVAPVPAPPPQHQAVVSAGWPLRDVIELGSLPGAVPCARLHARHLLREWGLARLAADAELLVSELVTNAVAASRSADPAFPVRLWLLADQARVLILVWDASPLPPVPAEPDRDAESGRGLLLVQALSQRWDWYPCPETHGKIVWALVAGQG